MLGITVLSTLALGIIILSPHAHALESCSSSSSSSSNSSGNTQTGSSDGNGSTDNNGTTPTDPTIIQPNALMQSITPTQCQALPTYDGTNDSALRTVTDTRGNTTQTYRIAKLADNHCWMLDNLKLGSTTSSTLLTPADSNVAMNFTLPQLETTGATDYDNPHAYGPVPGDTGSGATNYGYLYNWAAATAGLTRATATPGTDAPYSICAKGWRLATASEWDAVIGLAAENSNWLPTFKDVHAGVYAGESFKNQDRSSYLNSTVRTDGTPTLIGYSFVDNGRYSVGGKAVFMWGASIRCIVQ